MRPHDGDEACTVRLTGRPPCVTQRVPMLPPGVSVISLYEPFETLPPLLCLGDITSGRVHRDARWIDRTQEKDDFETACNG